MDDKEFDDQEISDQQKLEDAADNPPSSEENEGEMTLDTKNKNAIVSGSKKAIALLLKKKYMLIIIGIAIGLVSLILLISVLDSGEGTKFIYKESTCKEVTVNYDPYGNEEDSSEILDIEEYVRAAVYAYTKDLNAPPTGFYHVYYALSIALRNEVITNDCEVTYRDKKLTTSIPEDEIFDRAIENATGLTIIDDYENFIPVKVSDFCWSSDNEENYYLFQANGLEVPKTFTNEYLNNDIYRDCECNKYTEIETVEENDGDKCWTYWESDWDEEGNVIAYDREYLHQDDETGFSMMGAYHTLIKAGLIYTEQLKYFLGSEFQYRTITNEKVNREEPVEIEANNSSCMWWPIGSNETIEQDGVTMAVEEPATTTITSEFGYRVSPTAGASSNHQAIDIGGGSEGVTNIIAAASGIVISDNSGCQNGNTSCGGGLGNYVKIRHYDGTVTRYGHMSSINVANGDTVVQGQVIGKMGKTGVVTGTHLDFQVTINGTNVDPLNYVDPKNPRKKCSTISTGDSNQQTVCLNLLNYENEYSLNALAGIMGNIQAESAFNPSALNKSSGAYGLVQWLGGRKTGIQSACNVDLPNDELIACQVGYIFQELNSSESKAKKYLMGNDSAYQMGYLVCNYYERPEKVHCDSGVRQRNAENLLPYITNNCQ